EGYQSFFGEVVGACLWRRFEGRFLSRGDPAGVRASEDNRMISTRRTCPRPRELPENVIVSAKISGGSEIRSRRRIDDNIFAAGNNRIAGSVGKRRRGCAGEADASGLPGTEETRRRVPKAGAPRSYLTKHRPSS